MGIAKIAISKALLGSSQTGLKLNLFTQMLASMPEGTTIQDVVVNDFKFTMYLKNEVFNDGADLEASFNRELAVIDDGGALPRLVSVDSFQGIDFSKAIRRDVKDESI